MSVSSTVEFFASADGPLWSTRSRRASTKQRPLDDRGRLAIPQFEQHIRAIVGLPLGGNRRIRAA